jgi:hypothetical protein
LSSFSAIAIYVPWTATMETHRGLVFCPIDVGFPPWCVDELHRLSAAGYGCISSAAVFLECSKVIIHRWNVD